MRKLLKTIANAIVNLFVITCPNCESAYTGGHSDPSNRGPCVLCVRGDGTNRVWILRWYWLWSILVVRSNLRRIETERCEELLRRFSRRLDISDKRRTK